MANRYPDYKYKAKVVRVVDGDTIEVIIDLGFRLTIQEQIRLADIDTPELRPRKGTKAQREQEKQKAREARDYVMMKLADYYYGSFPSTAKDLYIRVYKGDSFGRWIADIYLSATATKSLNQMLLEEGLAKPYKR